MTTMIERVARALWAADKAPWDPAEFESLAPEIQEQALKVARAAIAAMREPTEAMIEAGGATEVAGFDGEDDRNMPVGEYEAEEAYRAMIGAALEEKP